MKCIVNGRLVLPDGIREDRALLFDSRIRAIVPRGEAPADCETIDAGGAFVAPGFVDVHIHGYLGEDASDASAEGIRRMAEGVVQNGVTSFLPTTMTVAWAQLERVFTLARALKAESESEGFRGAQILGVHAEGPFICPARKGAQAGEHILAPDAARVLPYADIIRLITIAPEMPGGLEFIRQVRANSGIRVSLGHTDAAFEQALAAFDAGATHVTHTFNAMTPLVHRSPGVVGAALGAPVYCELIADTFHVHRGLFPLLARVKGERLVLITDCTRAGGLADGTYDLGGQEIFVKGIECRLADGTIAGSVLKLNQAVRNMRLHGGVPLHEAVNMASLYPACAIGAQGEKGSLAVGKDADITLFDDDINILSAYVRGQCRHEKQ